MLVARRTADTDFPRGAQVQSISMLAHLNEQGVNGPFMVVGPLSTLYNWHNEFKKWTPSMESVIYHGSKDKRKEILGSYFRGKQEKHFPVMITSYEIVIRDIKELKKIQWKFVIIDEGHRLKNMNCRVRCLELDDTPACRLPNVALT